MAKKTGVDNVAARNSDNRLAAVERDLAGVESDVAHLDEEIVSLRRETVEGFASIRRALQEQTPQFTQFAGWASVLLALVGAVLWPLYMNDTRHQTRIQEMLSRELVDAETRGRNEQRFQTITESISSAMMNRKDITARLDERIDTLSTRITETEHSLDNGLGSRIDEKLSPLHERIKSLEDVEYKTILQKLRVAP